MSRCVLLKWEWMRRAFEPGECEWAADTCAFAVDIRLTGPPTKGRQPRIVSL